MKHFLAVVGSFLFTLAVFVSGAALAMWFLAAKPVQQAELTRDTSYLWTKEPRTVATPVPGLERLPARPVEADVNATAKPKTTNGGAEDAELVDKTTTGSVTRDATADAPSLPAAHLDWCASRYRSYRASDNSYAPYSGGRRNCISPYLEDAVEARAAPVQAPGGGEPAGIFAAAESRQAALPTDHIEYCFSRYRSYRPEDNTYQPYGGGPRRQCE